MQREHLRDINTNNTTQISAVSEEQRHLVNESIRTANLQNYNGIGCYFPRPFPLSPFYANYIPYPYSPWSCPMWPHNYYGNRMTQKSVLIGTKQGKFEASRMASRFPMVATHPQIPSAGSVVLPPVTPVPEIPISAEDVEEPSLEDISVADGEKQLFNRAAYQKRNVHKCIVRKMHSLIHQNREAVVAILQDLGYPIDHIEHAFIKINNFNKADGDKGVHKRALILLKKMIKRKTIYTAILQETLGALLGRLNDGENGKISRKNLQVYKSVSQKYYSETVLVLGREAKGVSLSLQLELFLYSRERQLNQKRTHSYPKI